MGKVPALVSARASGTIDGWSSGQNSHLMPLIQASSVDPWPQGQADLMIGQGNPPQQIRPPTTDLHAANSDQIGTGRGQSTFTIPSNIPLSAWQLAKLSEWLDEHRWNWSPLLYTPPPG